MDRLLLVLGLRDIIILIIMLMSAVCVCVCGPPVVGKYLNIRTFIITLFRPETLYHGEMYKTNE